MNLNRELFSLQKSISPKSSQTVEEWLQALDDNQRVIVLYCGDEHNKQSSNIKDAYQNYMRRILFLESKESEKKEAAEENMRQLAVISKGNIDEIVENINETRALADVFHKRAEKATTRRASYVKCIEVTEDNATFEVCFAESDFSGNACRTVGMAHGKVDVSEHCQYYRVMVLRDSE